MAERLRRQMAADSSMMGIRNEFNPGGQVMSYRCGVGPGIKGIEPGPPGITCDSCGLRTGVTNRHGMPLGWFMNNKPVPGGWKLVRDPDGIRRKDYCPRCKDSSMMGIGTSREESA
jgi:hypothetical protein